MVHLKYEGRSETIEFDVLFPTERYASIGIAAGTTATPQTVSEQQIRLALAQHFDVGLDEFEEHFIEINPNGNITVRPEAVFG